VNDGGWLARENGLACLLECVGRRTGRTLPVQYRGRLARPHAQERARTRACTPGFSFLWVREDGRAVYEASCDAGHAHRDRAVDLAVFDARVAEFVTSAVGL
jgi:hypothetical protein